MKSSVLLSIALLALVSCRQNPTVTSNDQPAQNLPSLEKKVTSSDNAFGLKLFNRISGEEKESNIFISPLSVSMALGMALNGAGGATLDSMREALQHSDVSMDEINRSYQSISSSLAHLDPSVQFQIANSIWYRNGFPVYDDFIDRCTAFFDAEIQQRDFTLPSTLTAINDWVNDKTNGKIPTIFDEMPPDLVLCLSNAIYFKGTWTYQFNKDHTSEMPFWTSRDSAVQCSMMSQHATYGYYDDSVVQVIDLPYGGRQFSMTIILPRATVSTDSIAASLNQQQWNSYIDRLDSSEVDLYLPKFKLKYTKILNDDLTGMGMGVAFTDRADFSRLSSTRLLISLVLHKTYVEVDEEGTEAAAVTVIGFRTSVIGNEPQYPSMWIDHPFIFAIREHTSGTILFIGKVNDPTR